MRVLENLIAAVSEQLHLLATSQLRDSAAAAGANSFHAGGVPAPAGQIGGSEK
jgi:hypothetical protein